MASREEVEASAKKKAAAFAAVFRTPDGERVLEAIRQEFDKDELRGNTVEGTYFNLGRRDVLVYIEQMIRYSERDKDEKFEEKFSD
ncbi:hypothetical protein phiVC8_p06 [Vibrio phage phiVC8]|uniref:Bbp19-like phage domain-containing protein n=1 Tax=Vibrio phage phiVC8 TaxID=1076759 RepID=G3FFL5_BPVC8|nr:hypothetical protein phiVC8_p06 [Vibrio phage phiVC8]AEM62903.1 hypothetical protein phiVC8_p06 [Vibrio phage phiVC8]